MCLFDAETVPDCDTNCKAFLLADWKYCRDSLWGIFPGKQVYSALLAYSRSTLLQACNKYTGTFHLYIIFQKLLHLHSDTIELMSRRRDYNITRQQRFYIFVTRQETKIY